MPFRILIFFNFLQSSEEKSSRHARLNHLMIHFECHLLFISVFYCFLKYKQEILPAFLILFCLLKNGNNEKAVGKKYSFLCLLLLLLFVAIECYGSENS
jgi:hypothetical protein